MTTDWWLAPCQQPDETSRQAAGLRQQQLTKPPGSLGRLEALAIQLAALQGQTCPQLDRLQISLFAGDHGVVAEGVSPYPQAVTVEMLRNFARGGAALSVLARQLGAPLQLVNLGTVHPVSLPGLENLQLGPGTANFCQTPAMETIQCLRALQAGYRQAEQARVRGVRLFIGGEMGIGNTTVAAALAAVLLNLPAAVLSGPGTGLDHQGVRHKIQVIERALALHAPHCQTPLESLRRLGGFELAALAGAYLGCAQLGLPVLVDGFICSVAALCAVRLNPGCQPWLIFAHRSAEPGHQRVLQALDAEPLLDLGLRLGEGSGAVLAVPLLQQACALHRDMATFTEAAVSGRPA